MKKILTLGMIMLMAFAMIGCGKSEPAEAPEEVANEIEVEVPEETEAITVSGHTFENVELYQNDEKIDANSDNKFEFAEDGTFTQGVGEFKMAGEYTEDETSVTLTYKDGENESTMKLTKDGDTLIMEGDEPQIDDNGNLTGENLHMKSIFKLAE